MVGIGPDILDLEVRVKRFALVALRRIERVNPRAQRAEGLRRLDTAHDWLAWFGGQCGGW